MKVESIYPAVPSAPAEVTESTGYRIQHISSLQQRLENEAIKRETLARKYATAAGIVSKLDVALITVGIGVGAGGAVLLATVVAAPVAIGLEVVAGVCGIGGAVCTFLRGRLNTKRNKHSEIATIARTKLNSIADLVGRALQDGVITAEEFQLVVAEFERFNVLKNVEKTTTKNC